MENIAIILTSFITVTLSSLFVCSYFYRKTKNLIIDNNKKLIELKNKPLEEEYDVPEEIKTIIEDSFNELYDKVISQESVIDYVNYNNTLDKYHFKYLSSIFGFKYEVASVLQHSIEEEDFEKAAYIRDLIKSYNLWFEKRKQFFKSHVGKHIYLSNKECNCNKCLNLKNNGILIKSEEEAMYYFGQENSYKIEGKNKRFFIQ